MRARCWSIPWSCPPSMSSMPISPRSSCSSSSSSATSTRIWRRAPACRSRRSPTSSSSISITPDEELEFFGQELMELARSGHLQRGGIQQALVRGPQLARGAGHRRRTRGEQSRCARRADQLAGVANRSHQRRCIPVRQLGLRGGGGLSARERDRRVRVRSAGRHHVHGLRVERADADQDRVGLRSRGGRATPAASSCERSRMTVPTDASSCNRRRSWESPPRSAMRRDSTPISCRDCANRRTCNKPRVVHSRRNAGCFILEIEQRIGERIVREAV